MLREQTLTFAVVCQVANLVQTLSRTGKIDEDELSILLRSITITSPQNSLEVYGGELQNIKKGLVLLVTHLGGNSQKKDPEFTRYIVNLLNLLLPEKYNLKKNYGGRQHAIKFILPQKYLLTNSLLRRILD